MLETIVSILQNIGLYFSNLYESFNTFLTVVGRSLDTAVSLVSADSIFPTFLYPMIQLVIGVLVVKAILSLGSHHE